MAISYNLVFFLSMLLASYICLPMAIIIANYALCNNADAFIYHHVTEKNHPVHENKPLIS